MILRMSDRQRSDGFAMARQPVSDNPGTRTSMPIRFDEIISIDRLQALFDAFYTATKMGVAIASLDGNIWVRSGWQDICTQFYRRNPESEKLCVQSDTRVHEKGLSTGTPSTYRCPHGLIDASMPIVVHDSHIANLLTGQFLFHPPDEKTMERFRKQALKWGFDEDAYMEALSAVPILPEKRVNLFLPYLEQVAEMIGEVGSRHKKREARKQNILDAHVALGMETGRRQNETCKYAQILEGNPIPTFVIDADCQISHWNRACEMLTTIPAADMIGTDNHREAFYIQRRELMADLIVRRAGADELSMFYGDKYQASPHIEGGYEGEDFFPSLGECGKWLFFTAAPLKDANGRISGAIETLQDVTPRREAEQERRASEDRYRQLFESAYDAIFILKDGMIIDCNRKAVDLFKSSRKAMIGLSPLELSPDTQPDGALSRDAISKKEAMVMHVGPQVFEWRFLRRDGSQFDAGVSLTRFKLTGTPHGIAIVRDVTERNKWVQTLKHSEKELAEKTSYLEKVNLALKASLDHREVEKRAVEEHMFVNLKRFVFPYLNELGKCKISPDAKAYVNIIATNLNDIVSQLPRTVFSKYIDFTPTEVRIADLIREGRNSKAIAQILRLSPSSVQWHRKNIRGKLGLTNKKVNLQTYLTSLPE